MSNEPSHKRISEIVGQSLLSYQREEHKDEICCFVINVIFLIGFLGVNYHMAKSRTDA